MGDNTILTPGMTGAQECAQPQVEQDTQYLVKDNYLGEFENEVEKSLVLENLGVYPKTKVYTKTESDIANKTAIKEALQQHLNSEDPHGIIPQIENELIGVVRQDGSTPFLNPQTGVDPISEFHLTTKRFVQRLLNDHLLAEDPHKIIDKVQDILTNYVKLSQVYLKNQVYTTQEVDSKLSGFLKKDGTTPFVKPQLGVEPVIDSHLATKRYVDQVMWNHISDIDPHGFISLLNNRLANYYKKSETYSKAETYSRIQLDTIIRSLVADAAREAIEEHVHQFDPHNILPEIRKENYVKQDGSTPFRNIQKGVEGVEENDLVVLSQLNKLKEELSKEISAKEITWVTSGPVQTTVGFVEDNTELPKEMTFQEIMDAIFYGKSISIDVPDYVTIGDKCPVTLCIHGSLGLVQYAELYQNGELIYTLSKEDFESGCITVDSLPILVDTTFTFKVYYLNGAYHEVSASTSCGLPVFIGLLPKWKPAYTITMEYLKTLEAEDSEGTQNRFVSCGNNIDSLSFDYKFQDAELRHPFIVLPKSYPDLQGITTSSQNFGIEAFDVISDIPLEVEGVEDSIIFKIYVYKQALSSLNQKITFNF